MNTWIGWDKSYYNVSIKYEKTFMVLHRKSIFESKYLRY
jgi:hypothetical protein